MTVAHLPHDRRGDRAAVAVGVDDHRRDDDLRLAGRGEGGEPGVGVLLGLLAGLPGLERARAELGGAGLAGDLDSGSGAAVRCRR